MPKRSWVWKHYDSCDGQSECKICAKRIKSDKCTTNMMKHLKVLEIYKETTTTLSAISENVSSYADTNERKKKIDDLILSLVIDDLQPLTIVEDKGFVRLINFLDPKYKLPSRKTLKAWLNAKYELESIDKICLTTDTWTSINTDIFITATCHYISNNFELISRTLETKKFMGKHTSVAIVNQLFDICKEWRIENKITTIVTDNAPNMLAAVASLKSRFDVESLPCFVHTLNLIVKHSTILGLCNHKLIMEVETQWNSTYNMFQRLIEQRSAIALALSTLKINFETLNENEWDILSQILPLLKPFFINY
ncbi:hypothetical protein KPH14_007632 [Odynerus spinipes]|uniref:BED-type domain-containing protein n=1 Tax=Odynerus spinipes TaxID=1348599 RepID=A0AAD9RHR7_9HYME|nr:hypothetical protein KPH14_007632 [Odynerus spinipes]